MGGVRQGKLCRGPDSRAAALPGDFKPGLAGFPEGGHWKCISLAATPSGARATAALLGRADWINDSCRVSVSVVESYAMSEEVEWQANVIKRKHTRSPRPPPHIPFDVIPRRDH